MDEVLQELKKINQQLERVNERLDRVEERLDRVEERLNNLEEASQVTRDIVKDMELRFEERFDRLEGRIDGLSAGQKDIHADIAGLRRELFLESGSREHADTVQGEEFHKLERRVAALEAQQGLRPQAA